jgi:hypothetical protein
VLRLSITGSFCRKEFLMSDKRKEPDKVLNDTARDRNPDPITGEPGSHPVGTGIGAAGGGTAGAAVGGAVGGPIGAAVGAAVGAVAGGLAGKGIAEKIDPTVEDAYWRENYSTRPYVEKDTTYDVYQPAYRYGWESRGRYPDKKYEDVEPELQRDWGNYRGTSNLTWDRAKFATKDAWHRIEEKLPGDADDDGR